MEVLRTRPYELCAISGFGFKTVDSIARKIGCPVNDSKRIQGALQYAMDESQAAGHLFLPKEKICEKAYVLLNEDFPAEVADKKSVVLGLYQLVQSKRMFSENGNIYTPRNFDIEVKTAVCIAKLLMKPGNSIEISTILSEIQNTTKIQLSKKQAEAIITAYEHRLSIITGGPVTGKTTTLKILLEVFKKIQPNGKVLLSAPTGRASRRMAESTGYTETKTLHSALSIIYDGDSDYVSNRDPIDADQLSSVDAGNVFRELIACGLIPVTVLDMVFRQSKGSRIAMNAHAIKQNKTSLLYGNDFVFINCETAYLIQKYYRNEVAASGTEYVQILSPFRSRGAASVEKLNEVIHELVNPDSQGVLELKVGVRIYRLGDKVVQTKNKGDISNGDVGFIKSMMIDEDSDSTVSIEFSGVRVVEYAVEDMDMIEPAYAMTIHKSQGAEYPIVIMPVLNSFYIMLKRNLLYTAITRARTKVILIGQKSALFAAIHRNDVDERNTLSGKRIQVYCKILSQKKKTKELAEQPVQVKSY